MKWKIVMALMVFSVPAIWGMREAVGYTGPDDEPDLNGKISAERADGIVGNAKMSGSEGFWLGCRWIDSAKDIPVPEEVVKKYRAGPTWESKEEYIRYWQEKEFLKLVNSTVLSAEGTSSNDECPRDECDDTPCRGTQMTRVEKYNTVVRESFIGTWPCCSGNQGLCYGTLIRWEHYYRCEQMNCPCPYDVALTCPPSGQTFCVSGPVELPWKSCKVAEYWDCLECCPSNNCFGCPEPEIGCGFVADCDNAEEIRCISGCGVPCCCCPGLCCPDVDLEQIFGRPPTCM